MKLNQPRVDDALAGGTLLISQDWLIAVSNAGEDDRVINQMS